MKYYTITVNGNTYEVSVEENSGVTAASQAPIPMVTSAPAPVAPVQRPAPAAASAPAPKASSGVEGSVKISSPMPGKILSIKATVGQAIKKGEVILILEAMKMENEVVATDDGTIASINVTAGQSVEAGDFLATLN